MEELNLNTLAERLKASRKAKKKTQDEVAKAIGVNKYTISDWERGAKQPGILNIVNYCNFLGITLDELLGFKKNRELHLTISEEEREAILAMIAACEQETKSNRLQPKMYALGQYLKAFFNRAQE